MAKVSAGAKARQPCHLVDGVVARLEQFTGEVDAAVANPRTRGLTGLLAEPAVEGACTHFGVPGQSRHRELLAEMLQRPLAGGGGRELIGCGHLPVDELCLPAFTP